MMYLTVHVTSHDQPNANANLQPPTHSITMSYHAHFDCFSGAAGDMMLAACLDAADHLPQPKSCALPPSSTQLLLARIASDLERGMPEHKGEFGLSTKRVWRSLGRIAARKVDVTSVYRHVAAPVPGAEMMKEQHEHSHEHGHSHQHEHQHEHQHKHDHGVSGLLNFTTLHTPFSCQS